MNTCDTCTWNSITVTTDDDEAHLYEWLCWRDSGCPSQRMLTRLKVRVPKACSEWWCEDA